MKYLLIALLLPLTGISQLKIEAESYISMKGLQTEVTTDVGGGKNVGYIDPGDTAVYTAVLIPGSKYRLQSRVASVSASKFSLSGKTVNVPVTGGYQTWITMSDTLTYDGKPLTIKALTAGWNINWFSLTLLQPVYEEVMETGYSFDFDERWILIYYKNRKTDSIRMPKRPVQLKQ